MRILGGRIRFVDLGAGEFWFDYEDKSARVFLADPSDDDTWNTMRDCSSQEKTIFLTVTDAEGIFATGGAPEGSLLVHKASTYYDD